MFNVESEENMAKKVLVVDDEKLIVKGIRFSLEQDGMEVDCAYDGEEALSLASSNQYDVILLDVMLPKLTGFEVCQQIRESSDVPIIMLTAKGEDMDKILGLEYGADDYITKPFNILEVKARIRAIIRRSSSKTAKEPEKVLSFESLRIDLDSRRGYIDDKEVNLTAKEYIVVKNFSIPFGDMIIRVMSEPSMYIFEDFEKKLKQPQVHQNISIPNGVLAIISNDRHIQPYVLLFCGLTAVWRNHFA